MTTSQSSSTPPPSVVTKAYDVLLWCVQHVGKFPRSHRFLLGDRIEGTMLQVVLLLVEAAYEGRKEPLLRRANLELEKLRILLRLSKDLGLTSLRQYEFISHECVGLGQQVGGWLRFQRYKA